MIKTLRFLSMIYEILRVVIKGARKKSKAFRSRAASRIVYGYTPSRHVLFLTMCCKQKRVTELSGTWKVKMWTQRLVVIGERFC